MAFIDEGKYKEVLSERDVLKTELEIVLKNADRRLIDTVLKMNEITNERLDDIYKDHKKEIDRLMEDIRNSNEYVQEMEKQKDKIIKELKFQIDYLKYNLNEERLITDKITESHQSDN